MTYQDWNENWRSEHGIKSKSLYKKKWAWKPVICSGNDKVWLKTYYAKYQIWYSSSISDDYCDSNSHTDFVENITEQDYLVRKLAENL